MYKSLEETKRIVNIAENQEKTFIIVEKDNKIKYIPLLLEADPSKKLVTEYLEKGDLFTLYYKDEWIICNVEQKL